ncbi:MAG: single-stranded DNA-binding protein [Verrucomicrobiae bacterium]|nr:single-stranded DNA-binding protein [Verrucomicrobiae bacterium]
MANLNKVLLIGNLTRDPEVRYTPKGTAVAQIGLAVNRVWNDDQGQQKEEVTFIDVEAWGRTAETAGKYLTKGRPVFIEGRLKLDSWEDKETKQKRSKMKVVAEMIQFLGAPRNAEVGTGEAEGGGAPAPRRQAPRPAASPAASPPAAEGAQEDPPKDDIPF